MHTVPHHYIGIVLNMLKHLHLILEVEAHQNDHWHAAASESFIMFKVINTYRISIII